MRDQVFRVAECCQPFMVEGLTALHECATSPVMFGRNTHASSQNDGSKHMNITSDMLAAVIFIIFGIAAIALGWGYGFGSMSQMGTGAMPVLAGIALSLLGLVQFANAARTAADGEGQAPAFFRAELRPLLLILGAVFAFAVLIRPAGLIPALTALVVIAWFAQKGGRRWEIAGALVGVILLMIAIFKYGLGLPLRLFGGGF